MSRKSVLAFGTLMILAPALAACGGGSGAASGPQTPSAVAVPPPPAPPPPPPSNVDYNTPEYQRSNAATKISAITAYAAGATGQGIMAAVIDSGVNPSLPEFAGKISAASRDIASNRGMGDEDGHGTSVAAVLLGAKNDSDTHGVAFNATLLALRTDTPGSCANTAPDGGCSHNDMAIASALDIAVSNGAKVVNMSLGGAGPNSTLRAAMGRATAAGTILVISAGNDGLANPDAFALIASDAVARNLIIVAGGVDDANAISVFSTGGSNQAGSTASRYVVALANRVRTINETGVALSVSGDVRTGQVGPLAMTDQAQRTARLMAGWVVSRLSRDTQFAAGFARSSGALIDQMALNNASRFLVAEEAGASFGFRSTPVYSGAVRQQFGRWGLSAGWDRGEALVWSRALRNRYDRMPFTSASVSLDRRFGPLSLAVKGSQLSEKETVLGARFGAMFGAPGSVTRQLSVDGNFASPGGWALRGRWQQGWTRVRAGGVRPASDHLISSAWSFDATREGMFLSGDRFGLRLAQPVRLASGGLTVELPVTWDYATSSAQTAVRRINLAPSGREIDAEALYAVPLWAGSLSTSVYWRKDPGHVAAAPDDTGAALRFGMAF